MSFVATLESELVDIEAVKLAAEELGLEWVSGEGRKLTGRGYASSDNFQADHLVRIPKCRYDIGAVIGPEGRISLVGDTISAELVARRADLKQYATLHEASRKVSRWNRRARVSRVTQPNGTIRLRVEL